MAKTELKKIRKETPYVTKLILYSNSEEFRLSNLCARKMRKLKENLRKIGLEPLMAAKNRGYDCGCDCDDDGGDEKGCDRDDNDKL